MNYSNYNEGTIYIDDCTASGDYNVSYLLRHNGDTWEWEKCQPEPDMEIDLSEWLEWEKLFEFDD